jgi:hypothetical protein
VKLKEFLTQPNVKSILERNGFPIKVKIPLTFFLDVEINFQNFKEINQFNTPIHDLFTIPSNYTEISRKVGQNIKDNEKKRLALANFAI